MTMDFMFGFLSSIRRGLYSQPLESRDGDFLTIATTLRSPPRRLQGKRWRFVCTKAKPGAAMIPERPPQLHAAAAESGRQLV
ncbi:MAG: hypothetical protein ROZ37_04305 [Aromatoleum sp.]|jgi:hypothetical protein|uniref:hypothetical protein n=1 Tax=Aromatoleum sp. TaxID=2307007 RepID=UPI0028961336|nr:hypothetical protein [Aromatoleum sp.]MDT3669541.1 hypothetical protein [Aromatoleum sp.]